MNELEIKNQNTITSLELLEQINIFRKEEGKRKDLRHDTLLNIIRDEFEEEIQVQKILELFRDLKVGNGAIKKSPYYIIPLPQAKQVLMRESKFVRRAVIHYIEALENKIKEQPRKMTTAEFLFEQSKLMVEFEKRLDDTESRIKRLEREKGRISKDKDKMTVLEYAILKDIKPYQYKSSWVGGKATYLCKKKGLPIGRVLDVKHGYVNSYPIDILELAFYEIMDKIRKQIPNIVCFKN